MVKLREQFDAWVSNVCGSYSPCKTAAEDLWNKTFEACTTDECYAGLLAQQPGEKPIPTEIVNKSTDPQLFESFVGFVKIRNGQTKESAFPVVTAAEKAASKSSGFKIGYVDLARVRDESNDGKAAFSKLKADFEEKQKKLTEMQGQIAGRAKSLENRKSVLSPEGVAAEEAAIIKELEKLKSQGEEMRAQFNKASAETANKIGLKVDKILTEMIKQEGYTAVIHAQTAIYMPPGANLTDALIRKMNEAK